ncbi:MAG: hypothetical protein JXA57_12370, partial [Armatimonadetes bacterium]|nr:hypothetical protein [Armatimonadota bacterium]
RNIGPLLFGLPQQLRKIAAFSPRAGTVWTGVDDGGSVELDLEVEGGISGEILIGFFRDAAWSGPPTQLRAFPGPGRYRVQRLPTGSYRVGAVVGSLPEPDAIGVHRSWPQPVTVERGETVKVQIRASPEFTVALQGTMYNTEIARGFAGTWKEIPPEKLVEGRVVIPGGPQIPYCVVEAHQSKQSYVPAYAGVDEGGRFCLEVPSWPCRLYASWSEPLPSLLGYRNQYLLKEESLHGPQKVDFHLEPFRTGTATVRGRAFDQDSNPVREFYLWATTCEVASARSDTGMEYYSFTNYRVPFMSEEGAFELGNLPHGVYVLRAMPFNSRAYVPFAHKKEVKLEDGQTLEVMLKVKAKNTFYGNVLAPGGVPEGTTICLSLSSGLRAVVLGAADSRGHFAIHLSDKEAEDLSAGSAFLLVSLQKGKRRDSVGKMPFELLSRDREKSGTWRLPSVKSGTETDPEDIPPPP